MENNDGFQFTRDTQDDGMVLRLEGVINERTDLNGLFENLEGSRIVIDLKGIKRINSCGVRDWVNATRPLADKYQIEYVACSRAVVDQLNMIVNFLSSGKLVSFYAPYCCDDCDAEHDMLIVIKDHFPDEDDLEEPEAPDFDCPSCGKTMELNEDEDKYFSFLTE